jgi:hypothetical protein
MPMTFDKRPYSAQKRQKTRAGEIPPPVLPEPEPAPTPLVRVRVLRRLTNSRKFGTLEAGKTVSLPADKAKELVSMGLAESDKMLDSAPETKS